VIAIVSNLWQDIVKFVNGMDMESWLVALVVVIAVGVLCMRGFGSRSGY